MKVRFDVYISTFIENSSRNLVSTNEVNFKEISRKLEKEKLNFSQEKIQKGFFWYDNRWCFFIRIKEAGQTLVGQSKRDFDETYLAVSETELNTAPSEVQKIEGLNQLMQLKPRERMDLAPFVLEIPKTSLKLKSNLMKKVIYIALLMMAGLFISLLAGRLFSKITPSNFYKLLGHTDRQKPGQVKVEMPFENDEPQFLTEILSLYEKRGFKIESVLADIASESSQLSLPGLIRPGNSRLKFITSYVYFINVLEQIKLFAPDASFLKLLDLQNEKAIISKPNLILAKKYSSKKLFADLEQELDKLLENNGVGSSKDLSGFIKEGLKIVSEGMVERDKTIEIWWFQRPKLYHLALFLPCSKNCQGHIDGYNENYLFDEEFLQKKKVSSWEDIPIAYGFKTWENMSEEKNVYLDRSLKKIATKLLEGLEK